MSVEKASENSAFEDAKSNSINKSSKQSEQSSKSWIKKDESGSVSSEDYSEGKFIEDLSEDISESLSDV